MLVLTSVNLENKQILFNIKSFSKTNSFPRFLNEGVIYWILKYYCS